MVWRFLGGPDFARIWRPLGSPDLGWIEKFQVSKVGERRVGVAVFGGSWGWLGSVVGFEEMELV
jgi:hypothetical protein